MDMMIVGEIYDISSMITSHQMGSILYGISSNYEELKQSVGSSRQVTIHRSTIHMNN